MTYLTGAIPFWEAERSRKQTREGGMVGYSVTCECGVVYSVSPTDAGLPIACPCGKSFYVPSLATLRLSANETPIPQNTIETIQAMIDDGRLPDGDACPFSSRPANETVFFRVQCETAWTVDGEHSMFEKLILFAIFGWIVTLLMSSRSQSREFGRDTSIDVPLRISADCREAILRIKGQSKLKRLLSRTPIYAKLLQEFPKATVEPLQTR